MTSRHRTELAERERELSAVRGAFHHTIDNRQCSIMFIEGSPGCGRTAFLKSATEEVTDYDAVVLSATCSQIEQHLDFAAVRQLLQNCKTPPAARAAARRIDENTLAAMSSERSVATRQLAMTVHNDVFTVLHALAERRQLVLLVLDDAHHIDDASAQCLLYVVRRLQTSPVVVILSDSTTASPACPVRRELESQPSCRTVRLEPLSRSTVRLVVAERLSDGDLDAVTESCHAVTGGNPLLVQAFLDDCEAGGTAPGHAFNRTVFRCLDRAPEPALLLACGMAVLDGNSSPGNLARLLSLRTGEVEQAIGVLTKTGLLRDGRFRHSAVRSAVLSEMAPHYRAELHRRAAQVLLDTGATTKLLAQHLIAAQTTCPPWAAPTLHKAARQAAAEGNTSFAEQCLELAATDEAHYGATKAMLLELAWRTDPSEADRHVPGLFTALTQHQLAVKDVVVLIRHLLWHGRISEAAQALASLGGAPDFVEAVCAVRDFQLWLTHAYPPMAALVPVPGEESPNAPGGCEELFSGIDLQVMATNALSEVLTNHPDQQTVPAARQILRSRAPYELTFMSTQAALLTLVFTDQLAEAAQRCDRLLADAVRANAPTWLAVLTGIKAEICRRSGDPEAAAHFARSALEQLPEKSWGVPVGQPLACSLLSMVALGRQAEAARLVERPVPPAIMKSAQGLIYRYACGQYHLMARSPQAALQGFTACGALAESWGLDMPTVVPWRGGAAEALTRLGQRPQARELLVEQLALVDDRFPRARGITLRQLAGVTDEPHESLRLLASAVRLLESCPDRLELARTHHELSAVYAVLGEPRRARVHTQHAVRIARDHGWTVVPARTEKPSAPASDSESVRAAGLSRAEQRVAVLAARGHTNREIAEHLFITPSTVEQHLTRVFRKLMVKQREDLPVELGLQNIGGSAGARPGSAEDCDDVGPPVGSGAGSGVNAGRLPAKNIGPWPTAPLRHEVAEVGSGLERSWADVDHVRHRRPVQEP